MQSIVKCAAMLVILLTLSVGNVWGTDYNLVTNVSQLSAGDIVVISTSGGTTATTVENTNGKKDAYWYGYVASTGSVASGKLTALGTNTAEYTLSKSGSYWVLTCSSGYVGSVATKKLRYNTGTDTWTIVVNTTNYQATISSTTDNGSIQFNSDRFRTYTSSQTAVYLFKKAGACTAPSSVSISGTNKYLGGQTISLTATPSGGSGTTTYQWQKKISGVWTNLSNGTASGVTTSGATSNNLQISSCTHENAGGYRCIVSTGATCSTNSHTDGSDGYGVHVYSLYGRYYDEGDWVQHEIPWTSGTTGTATIHLSAKKTYTFKIRSNNDLYYGSGSGNYIITTGDSKDCGTGNSDIRLFTGPEGDYTFTVNIEHGLDNTPYVNVVTNYPSVSHPNTGYVYVQKFSWRPYLHYWYDNDHVLSTWGYDPQINSSQYTEICGTEYWYVPVIEYYCNFIAKDAAGDPSNTTGDQHTNSPHPGQRLYNDGSWKWGDFVKYTITFAGNGNTGGSTASVEDICPGSNATLTANGFTKTGYTFDGWTPSANVTVGSTTYTPSDVVPGGSIIKAVSGNLTMTAHWTEDLHNVTVEYKCGATTVSSSTTIENVGITTTGTTTAPASFTGYTWSTWSDMPSGVTTSTTPLTTRAIVINATADGKTITANYTANQYSITYKDEGDVAYSGSNSGSLPGTHTYGSATALVNGAKTGYDFVGWYTDKTCTVSAGSSIGATAITSDITLYAKWTLHDYTISSTLNNCTSDPSIPSSYTYTGSAAGLSYTLTANSGYALPSSVTVSGVTYTWNQATGVLALTGTISSDVSITVTALPQVTWMAGGSVFNTQSGTAGTTLTNPGTPSNSTYCDGVKVFVGWSASTISGTTDTEPADLFSSAAATSKTIPAGGTTYYAVFATSSGGGSASETLSDTEITTNFTSSAVAYGDAEKSWKDGTVTWAGRFSAVASGPYMQLKSDNNVYIKIVAPATITSVDMKATLTSCSGSGCNVDIDEHANATATISLQTAASGGTTVASGTSTAKSITLEPEGSYSTLYIKVNGATKIWAPITVTYSSTSYSGYATTCAECTTAATVGAATLKGDFSLSSVGVTCPTSGTAVGTNCSWLDYGFVWSPSSNTTPTIGGTNCTKVQTGTSGSSSTWDDDLEYSSFTVGNTYYYRAYGKNGKAESDFVYGTVNNFTPRSVTFNLNGHGESVPSVQYLPDGGKASDPSYSEAVSGWRFDGWYKEEGCTNEWNFSSDVVSSENKTLYAKWTRVYSITYNYAGGTSSCADATKYAAGETVTVCSAPPTKAGSTFQGWLVDNNIGTKAASSTFEMPAANVTLTAQWEDTEYTLTQTVGSHTTKGHTGTTITSGMTSPSGLDLTYSISNNSYALPTSVTITGGGQTWTLGTNYTWTLSEDKHSATLHIGSDLTITANVTVTVAEQARYTVVWDEHGSTTTEYYASDDNTVTEKTEIDDCGEKKFYRWTEDGSFVSDDDTPPDPATFGTISGDKHYYAIYGNRTGGGGFVKVTSITAGSGYYMATGLTSSDYVYTGQNGANTYGACTQNNSTGSSFSGATLLAFPTAAKSLTVAISNGKFSLYDGTSYLGAANSNSLTFNNDPVYEWQLSTNKIQSSSYTSRYIKRNTTNERVCAYSTTDNVADFYLYKPDITWSNFSKTCELYDITITTPSGGTVTTTPTAGTDAAGEGQTVTVNVTPNSCKYLSALKYNDGSDHAINIASTPYTFTMPAADVTVTATFSDKTVSSIAPNTSEHRVLMQGSAFVGEQIRVTYNNGETEDLAWNDATLSFSGYNMSTIGNYTVTVNYTGTCGNASTSYSMEVSDGIPITFNDCGITSTTKYQPGDAVPVETTSGAYACSGWEFVGWSATAVANNSTSFSPVRNFNASTARTLYAVYAHIRVNGSSVEEYKSADRASELREGARYIIAGWVNSNNESYGMTAMLPTVTGTYYLNGTHSNNVGFAYTEVNESGSYRYYSTATLAANAHWQLMADGTGYWQLYNKTAGKYLDLTNFDPADDINTAGYAEVSNSPNGKLVMSDYNNPPYSNDSKIHTRHSTSDDTHSLSWDRTNSRFNQYKNATVFYLTKDEYFSSTPPCAPRSVTFHGNGGTVIAKTGTPTGADLEITEASRDAGIYLPTAETDAEDCDGKVWSFFGWIDHEVDLTRVPVLTTDLLNDGYNPLDPNPHYDITADDEEYWAVYTNTGDPETKYGTISFTKVDFDQQYSSDEKTITKTVSEVGDYTFGYKRVGHQSSIGIQFENGTGEFYNKTSLGKVTSISFTTFNVGAITNLKVYVGDEEKSTTNELTASDLQVVGSTYTYYPRQNCGYVYIKDYNAYVNIGTITVNFGQGTEVWATTPDCSILSLSGTVRVTSTSGKKVKAVTPLTISGHGLAANAVVSFAAYNVSDDTPNSHFTFIGSASADINGDVTSTEIAVAYQPTETSDGIEEVYFIASATASNGSSTTESNKQSGYGRHLPAKFVIATKIGDDWYALPNNITTASYGTRDIIPIIVDNATTPTTATVYNSTTDYLAWGMNAAGTSTDRYTTDGEKISFVSAINSKGLAGNASGLRNSAALPATTSGEYLLFDWKPSTTDLGNYTLQNGSVTTYYVATNGSDKWTTATTGADVRFLAYDKQPAPTITWQNDMLGSQHAQNTAENARVTLPAGDDPVSCNTTLYPTFCGWKDGQIATYATVEPTYVQAGDVVTTDKTYYAVFKDATRNRWYTSCPTFYTLTFQAGTGTGSDYVTYTENTTYVMPDAATTSMSKEGYTLSGWTTTVAVTVGGSPVAAGEVIAVGSTISGISDDMTFTAVWTGNIAITGNVWLTSYNGVTVYATSTTSNLITVSSVDATGATRFRIIYLDGNGDVVAKGSSLFRLCNNGSVNYNMVDASSDYVSVSSGSYSQTYSISYTPNAHNTINTGTLKLQLMHNSTVLSEATLVLHGRALPQEFVVVSKFDGEWYALPNTLAATEVEAKAVAGVKITVDNTTTPTKATYAPNTTVYQGEGRYAAGTNVYGIRLTDGTNHLQVSTTPSNNNMWLSPTGSAACQDWSLKSSDFGAYEVTIPSVGSKKIGMVGGNIGYYASPTSPSGQIYFLPIEHKMVDNPAIVTEWGQNSVILDVDAQTASSAQARLGAGDPEVAASFGQTLTSVKNAASKYNYTLSFSTLDFSAHKGELLYIDWLDGSSNVLSTSALTIPWIIASDGVMHSIDGTKGHWNTEVHVLPGVTLTADGGSFGSSTVEVKQLEIYPGATVNVTTGTLDVSQDLVLRNGWTRAGEKDYEVARLYIGSASLTTNRVYSDWYIDFDQYYPIAVPWNVTVANMSCKNSSSGTVSIGPESSDNVRLRYYDGASRAKNIQEGVGSGANWKQYGEGDNLAVPTTLTPANGYAMTARRPTGKAFSIIRMPLTIPSSDWTTGGEKGVVGTTHKDTVKVTAHNSGSTPEYAQGWNFIANPYMALHQGELSYDDKSGDVIEYANVPDIHFKEYDQVPIETTKLKPSSGFLVQAPKTGTVTFDATNRKASAPSYRQEPQSPKVSKQKAYIVLSNEKANDMMGLLISDIYTAEYELNADLEKILSDGNTLRTYMRYNDMNMAYVAINSVLAEEWIPVSVRFPETGEYTFSIHEASKVDELEYVYLIDYDSGDLITNLLDQSYTFYSSKGTFDYRFAINAKVGKRDVPTDIDVTDAEKNSDKAVKFLYRDKLYILRSGRIYDATGKQVKGGAQ